MKNPLFEEQFNNNFINSSMIILHLSGLLIISILFFIFYPSKELSYYFTRSAEPAIFNIVLFTTLAFISYLILKTATFNVKGIKTINISDWFLYTKIKPITYVWGLFLYGLFYTLFLILLFMPLFLVSASVAAINPKNVFAVIITSYLFSLNLYMIGFFLFTVFKKRTWFLTYILWLLLSLVIILGPVYSPQIHPGLILLKIQSSTNLLHDIFYPISVSLLLIILLCFFSWLLVYIYSRSLHEQKN